MANTQSCWKEKDFTTICTRANSKTSQNKRSRKFEKQKFIFFDIDGTLLNDEKMPLESTLQALRQLQKNGHEIAIATGRNLFLAQEVIDTFQLTITSSATALQGISSMNSSMKTNWMRMHLKNCCKFPMIAAIRLSTNQRMLWLVATNRLRTTQPKRCRASSSMSLTMMSLFI